MKGCPLACVWCHNPESQAPAAEFLRLENRCMACGRCSRGGSGGRRPGQDAARVAACPTGALQQVGRTWSRPTWSGAAPGPDLLRRVRRRRDLFRRGAAGAGSLHHGALELLRGEGVHTALDTCGFAPWDTLREAAALASLVLFDLKLMDLERHRAATGQSNLGILDNLKALAQVHPAIRIRVPIIPGINDDLANLEATAGFLAPLAGDPAGGPAPLPPHRRGQIRPPGPETTAWRTPAPTPNGWRPWPALFRARGLTTTIGGHP